MVKPRSVRHPHRVERQRRAGQRPRAERGDRGAGVPVAQPGQVTQQGLHVGQQLVGEADRLRVLQVGHAGRGRVDVSLRLIGEGVGQFDQSAGDAPSVVAQIEPQVGGDLVVAGPTGPQFAAEGAEAFEQAAFQSGVHVLVLDGRAELPGGARRFEVVERGEHAPEFVGVEEPGAGEHPRVRAGRGEVVGSQTPVELHAHRQARQRFRRAALKPSAP